MRRLPGLVVNVGYLQAVEGQDIAKFRSARVNQIKDLIGRQSPVPGIIGTRIPPADNTGRQSPVPGLIGTQIAPTGIIGRQRGTPNVIGR